jgi:transcriptional regulator with XRE-family HTH domain
MIKLDKDTLLSRIDVLCAEKNITRTTAFLESGVGKNFKSNLSTANPSMGKLTMLANYFGVTVEYLKGETEQKENPLAQFSPETVALVERISQLSPDMSKKALEYIDFISQKK